MADRLPTPPEYAVSHAISIQDHKKCISTNNRRKKVLRACDRCRVKKIKCDGFPPCIRCRRDGFVCTTENAAKNDFRRLSPEYTEVFHKTHSALKATIQSLYLMVRNGDTWDFDEPELDDRGEVIVHDIVQKLGYTLPCTEAESPTPPMAVEDEARSKEGASQHKKEIEDQVLKEEAVVADTGLLTPCQDEQSPPEQYVDKLTDDSKASIDGCVGSDTLNASPQHWVDGFYMDFSEPIWGTDMMAMNWQQSDLISKACTGTASANKVQLVQPLAFNMHVEDSQIRWF